MRLSLGKLSFKNCNLMDVFGHAFAPILPNASSVLSSWHCSMSLQHPLLPYQEAPALTNHKYISAGLFLLTVWSLVLQGCCLISQTHSWGARCFLLSLGLFIRNDPPSMHAAISLLEPVMGACWAHIIIGSPAQVHHKLSDVQTQLQTTQHLNQSSFAGLSV